MSLASFLGVTSSEVRAHLVSWRTHDRHGDPYTRGAYSYAVAGVEDGPLKLGEPIADTLFYAGEATSKDLGTVHGAIESGYRAANEIEQRLK
jgi:monoamine oxidase